jgi:Asp-tRNA(Asn)/Glu-tRNA(Gln) amidotransferase A subunit family amidase
VKDIVDTADMPTAMGSPIYAGWRPKADAAIVAGLRRLGASLAGKTTTTAFAFLDPTATQNPAAPGHTPGGSSAGSAAAVAAGMVPLAIGTQTGGSVVRPASYCGVAAIKPSFRLLPTVGIKCFSWTLDTPGLFAATIADLTLALGLLAGRDLERLDVPARPRFGLLRQDFAGPVEPESVSALEAAAEAIADAGAEVTPLAAPASLAEAWAAHPTIQDHEAKHALAWEFDNARDDLPPILGPHLAAAQRIEAAEYDSARRVANRARRDARDLFGNLDAVLTYAAPGAAPHGLGSTGEARFNRLWTLLGTPCVNVPGLVSAAGLPVGIQVIAPFGRDAEALAAAGFLERALSRRATSRAAAQ